MKVTTTLRQSNNGIYKTVVILWLSLSVGSIVLAAISWTELSRQMANAREMAESQQKLDAILKSLLDSETGARGYVITGNPVFLQPYQIAVTNLSVQFDQLIELVQHDPALLQRIGDLQAEAELSLESQRLILAARNQSFTNAAALVASREAKHIMDNVRSQVKAIYNLQANLRSDIREQVRDQLMRASLTSLIAATLGLIAGVFAFWLPRL